MTEEHGTRPLIEAKGLTRHYARGRGVASIDLRAHAGAIIGVVGANAAGKSTALRLLAARLRPDAGRLTVAGTDALRAPNAARRRIGYLPHRPPLYEAMTVHGYLAYCAGLAGLPGGEVRTAATRAMSRLDLEAVGGRLVRNLSQGYRQRVGLAQALVHDPAVIVLDEPTVGLDPAAARDFIAALPPLAEGRVILFATHLLHEVDAVCTDLLVIDRGRPAFCGPLPRARPGGSDMVVRFADAVPAERLRRIPQVDSVTDLGDGRYHVTAEGGGRRELMRAAVDNGWELLEWLPPAGAAEHLMRQATMENRE